MFNQRRIEKNVLDEPIGHRDKSEHIKNPDLEISLQRNYKAYRKTLKILAKIWNDELREWRKDEIVFISDGGDMGQLKFWTTTRRMPDGYSRAF